MTIYLLLNAEWLLDECCIIFCAAQCLEWHTWWLAEHTRRLKFASTKHLLCSFLSGEQQMDFLVWPFYLSRCGCQSVFRQSRRSTYHQQQCYESGVSNKSSFVRQNAHIRTSWRAIFPTSSSFIFSALLNTSDPCNSITVHSTSEVDEGSISIGINMTVSSNQNQNIKQTRIWIRQTTKCRKKMWALLGPQAA